MPTARDSPCNAFARQFRILQRYVDESEEASYGKHLLDERTVLASTQDSLNADRFAPRERALDFGGGAGRRLDKHSPQLVGSGILKSFSTHAVKFFQRKFVWIQKTHTAK